MTGPARAMDGVLVVDKPPGLTSHDVVAMVRRQLRERSVGHTGTLDPMATGVLPLVVGKATRLARFLSASRKRYQATIALGLSTDTYDAEGRATGGSTLASPGAALPREEAVREALGRFAGRIAQVPPAFSAKKVAGVAAHRIARRGDALPELPAVVVTVHEISVSGFEGNLVHVELDVSAGFYVRSLAHDLGQALGCGAHLAALRRTSSGEFAAAAAIPLAAIASAGPGRGLVALDDVMSWAPAVRLTEQGAVRARHGQLLRPEDAMADLRPPGGPQPLPVRLVTTEGHLLGIAESRPDAPPWPLHPSVVLT